jgi:four helix bundle protein
MRNIDNYEVMDFAHDLVLHVYRSTASFPREERYGMTSQLRRAAASIPLNAAEGAGRGTDRDFARFVRIALGSANELDYALRLARDLGYLAPGDQKELQERVERVRRMLSGLSRALSKNSG